MVHKHGREVLLSLMAGQRREDRVSRRAVWPAKRDDDGCDELRRQTLAPGS